MTQPWPCTRCKGVSLLSPDSTICEFCKDQLTRSAKRDNRGRFVVTTKPGGQ